jgi:hypothetical protein
MPNPSLHQIETSLPGAEHGIPAIARRSIDYRDDADSSPVGRQVHVSQAPKV